MKICYFTTGYFPVNKDSITAIEYFVFNLAEIMSARGHEIVLFGHPDSQGQFQVQPIFHDVKYLEPEVGQDHQSYLYLNLVKDFADCVDFANTHNVDVIHEQINNISYPLARFANMPVVSTMHILRNKPALADFYQASQYSYRVAPSKFVQLCSPELRIDYIVWHGVQVDRQSFNPTGSEDMGWLGRMVPNKGLHDAIEASRVSNRSLIVGGYQPNYGQNHPYYQSILKSMAQNQNVTNIGEISREDNGKFLGQKKLVLMPIKGEEAFGLVAAEANAVGTPVIAYKSGSMEEIIVDGVNGYLVEPDDINTMVDRINKIYDMSESEYSLLRRRCREFAEKNFSFNVMADKYNQIYQEIIKQPNLR